MGICLWKLESHVLWCLVGRWQSMRWAGPGRDSSRPTSKQAGRQAASSACTGTAALGRLGRLASPLCMVWAKEYMQSNPVQQEAKNHAGSHACQCHWQFLIAYLSCTACFASFAFALLSFVLLCTASAPAAASSLLLQYNACPQPFFSFQKNMLSLLPAQIMYYVLC